MPAFKWHQIQLSQSWTDELSCYYVNQPATLIFFQKNFNILLNLFLARKKYQLYQMSQPQQQQPKQQELIHQQKNTVASQYGICISTVIRNLLSKIKKEPSMHRHGNQCLLQHNQAQPSKRENQKIPSSDDQIQKDSPQQPYKAGPGYQQEDSSVIQKFNPKLKCDRGIRNIGNTCYMNSVLQCLHKSRYFTQTFEQKYSKLEPQQVSKLLKIKQKAMKIFSKNKNPEQEINPKPPMKLSPLLLQFIRQMWKQMEDSFKPILIKQQVSKSNYIFEGFNQNDAMQFFLTMLSVLDDELDTSPQQKQYVDIDHYQNEEQIYRLTKLNDKTRSKSIADQTFTGRYKVTYRCENYCKQYILFQKFNIHYINIPPQQYHSNSRKQPSLQECLNCQKKPNELQGDNRMTCDKCGQLTQNEKIMQVYETNRILVIGIKRFLDGYKNNAKINIPQILEVQDIIVNKDAPQYKNKKLQLYAAILHFGNLYGGHYTAVCFNYRTGRWVSYNDSRCQVLQSLDLSHAYVLFYELVDKNVKRPHMVITSNQQAYRHLKDKQYSRLQQLFNKRKDSENDILVMKEKRIVPLPQASQPKIELKQEVQAKAELTEGEAEKELKYQNQSRQNPENEQARFIFFHTKIIQLEGQNNNFVIQSNKKFNASMDPLKKIKTQSSTKNIGSDQKAQNHYTHQHPNINPTIDTVQKQQTKIRNHQLFQNFSRFSLPINTFEKTLPIQITRLIKNSPHIPTQPFQYQFINSTQETGFGYKMKIRRDFTQQHPTSSFPQTAVLDKTMSSSRKQCSGTTPEPRLNYFLD